MKVQPKVWFRPRARYLEWNFSSGAVLVKERVNRLQEDGFPAFCHLREFGLHSKRPMEIEDFSVEAVLPGHIGIRTGNLKLQW